METSKTNIDLSSADYDQLLPALFVKFGQREFMQNLLDKGHVFCNTLTYFRNYEDGNNIGDKDEALMTLHNYTDIVKIQLHPHKPNLKDLSDEEYIAQLEYPIVTLSPKDGKMRHFSRYSEDPDVNLFCIYSIPVKDFIEKTVRITGDMSAMGDTCVFIQPKVLIDRLTACLGNQGVTRLQHGLVEYYDMETHNGDLSIFHKRREYAHQSEYRFAVERFNYTPKSFEIGSLADAALIAPREHFEDVLKYLYTLPIDWA